VKLAQFPFVSSADETPQSNALPHGISSSLDANGLGNPEMNGLANPEMNGFEKSEMMVF